MRALKVKYKHLTHNGNGTIQLKQNVVMTIIKHNYTLIQIDGLLYEVDIADYEYPQLLPLVFIKNEDVLRLLANKNNVVLRGHLL